MSTRTRSSRRCLRLAPRQPRHSWLKSHEERKAFYRSAFRLSFSYSLWLAEILFGAAAAEEKLSDFGVFEDPIRVIDEPVLARLKNVTAVRELQGLPRVLLN